MMKSYGGNDQMLGGKGVKLVFVGEDVGEVDLTIEFLRQFIRKICVQIVVAGAEKDGGNEMGDLLLSLQCASEVKGNVGDLVLIEDDACLLQYDTGQLNGHVINEGTILADLVNKGILAEIGVVCANEHVVDVKREPHEEFLFLEVDIVILIDRAYQQENKIQAVFSDVSTDIVARNAVEIH